MKKICVCHPARLLVNQNNAYWACLMFKGCNTPTALFRSVKSASAYSDVIYILSCCDFLMIFNRMPYEYHCQLQMWDIYCSDCRQSARSDLFATMWHLTSSLWYKAAQFLSPQLCGHFHNTETGFIWEGGWFVGDLIFILLSIWLHK